jgi:NADP-dependent 3-hydroxy acid dehydrogenase YdfG
MQTMVHTNVIAVATFTRVFAPGMVARNKGHIVNISSVAGHEAYAGLTFSYLLHCSVGTSTALSFFP